MKCPICGADMEVKDSYAIPLPDKRTAIVCKGCWTVFLGNVEKELLYGVGKATGCKVPDCVKEATYGKDL